MAEFLLALADFDSKRVWVELGYTSPTRRLVEKLAAARDALPEPRPLPRADLFFVWTLFGESRPRPG